LQARDTEELLTAAGFKKQLVDAADAKPLNATPPYRLVSRTKNGTIQYTYADPDKLPVRVRRRLRTPSIGVSRRNAGWTTSGGAPRKTCGTGIPGDHSRREKWTRLGAALVGSEAAFELTTLRLTPPVPASVIFCSASHAARCVACQGGRHLYRCRGFGHAELN